MNDEAIELKSGDSDTHADRIQRLEQAIRKLNLIIQYGSIVLFFVCVVTVVAIVFALRPKRISDAVVSLHGAVEGPSDSNVLANVNPLPNVSCPVGLQFTSCSFVDGPGHCRNPTCVSVGGALGPTTGTTINGTYPNINIIPIVTPGECGDPITGAQCILRFDTYGRITNTTNTTAINNINITNSTTLTGTVGVPELKVIVAPFNCTGGNVLCQSGRDQYGRNILLADGPTCLPNTTLFGGDVTGLSTNITLANTPVVAGCYGGVTNNSIIIAEPCIDPKGRVISIVNQTFAFVLTNGTFGILSTPNQTTVTNVGPNVFQIGTVQNTDPSAVLHFQRLVLSPLPSQTVNFSITPYTLAVMGPVESTTTPTIIIVDTTNVNNVPELAMGLFNATNGSTIIRYSYTSYNTYWNPTFNTWESSLPNTTGYVVYASNPGGSLSISATSNSTTGGSPVTLDVNLVRITRSQVTTFVPLQVGPDPIAFPIIAGVGAETGINIVYQGSSTFDIPRLSMFMTYFNTRPRYQTVVFDVGQIFNLYEAYMDITGVIRSSTTSSDAGAFYYTGSFAAPKAFHWSIVPSPGLGNAVTYTDDTLVVSHFTVQTFRPIFISNAVANPHMLSINAFGLDNMTLGFGMYHDVTGWTFGDCTGPAYGFWKQSTLLKIIRTPANFGNVPVTPVTLVTYSDTEISIYLSTKIYGNNADIWGFQGNTSRPQWQIFSQGPGQQDILLDAWRNPAAANGIQWTDIAIDGARISKTGDTIYFQRLFGNNVSGGFNSYQNIITLSAGGVNLFPADTHPYGYMGTQVITFGGFAVVNQYYGGYFDENGIILGGAGAGSIIWNMQYVAGTLEWCRHANPGQGNPVAAALDCPLTFQTGGNIIISTPLAISGATVLITSAATFTNTATFSTTVTLNGSPQLATGLQVTSAGTGSTVPLNGSQIMISKAGANGGQIVEWNGLNTSRIYEAADIGNISVYMACDTSIFNLLTSTASCRYSRIQNLITYTCFVPPLPFDPNTECGFGHSILSVVVDIANIRGSQFPLPGASLCPVVQGKQNGGTWTQFACLGVTPTPGHPGGGPGISFINVVGGGGAHYIAGTTYVVPDYVSFTYVVDPAGP